MCHVYAHIPLKNSLVICRPPLLCVIVPCVRGLLKRGSPSSLFQVTCGSGYPWTRHTRVTLEPMSTATSDGSRVNLGAARAIKVEDGKSQKRLWDTNPSVLHSTDNQTVHHVSSGCVLLILGPDVLN